MSERTETLRRWFPVPFVAIVVLLLVLIVLTPNLLSTGAPSAGSLPTEAELVVDRAVPDNLTHLYVHGIGDVRYASISVAVGTLASWPPPASVTNLTFGPASTWRNSLVATTVTPSMLFDVNVTAVYIDSAGATADFVGVFAFGVSGGMVHEYDYVPASSGITNTPVTELPLTILLETAPAGGAP